MCENSVLQFFVVIQVTITKYRALTNDWQLLLLSMLS